MTKKALILCCSLLLMSGLSSIQAQSKRPNIIFIQTDDQAAWALGASGNRDAHTPNLDRFFREGAYLRNAFVSTPVCSPSRASLITSRYGTELGITDWINPNIEPEIGLSTEIATWPKLLADVGYFNGLIGKWHLGTQDRFHPSKFGFKYFMGFRPGGVPTKDPRLEVNGEVKQAAGFTVDILTDDALRFLGEHRDKTFMLMLNYRGPHTAYLPVRDEDWQKVKGIDLKIPDYPDLDIPRAKKIMREYLASVAAVDRNVGRVLAAVDELKLRDNTVVIFTSDHGYNIGHHGVWHKGNGHYILNRTPNSSSREPQYQRPNVFDTSLRTPTAVRWPGVIKPGSEIKQTVTNLDWFPTILTIAGVKRPANTTLRGRDITPLLRGRNVKWDDDLYVEWSQHHYVKTHLRMYRTPEWKLVRDFLNPGKDELYHLAVDPDENVNLITDPSTREIRRKLEAKMLERMRANGDPVLKAETGAIKWVHLSSKKAELPVPGESTQQTGSLVADFDKDGVNDFVLSFRKVAPALVWYRRGASDWSRYVIEKEFLTVEAGGAAFDIDGDGDQDIVFGGDAQSNQVWWWENPSPNFDPSVSWKRRLIKSDGARQHHDQAFGDFKGAGRAQLAFWNQGAKTVFLADIPKDPRNTEPWRFTPIFTGEAGEVGDKGAFKYPEGMAVADVDADGKVDLLAGNFWLKHEGGDRFRPIRIGTIGGRIAAGRLIKSSKHPQVVIAPGDGVGPLRWYECKGDPAKSEDWVGHDLAGRDLIHGHSLALGDINGDGHPDIFAAEMAKWTERKPESDNAAATAWIFYGDGKGNFRQTELVVGHGFHEARVADLDGDGDPDILNKPYNWEAPRVDVWLNNGAGARKQSKPVAANTRAGIGPSFKGPLGLQLYSLRAELTKDVPGTLAKVREMGFRDVEMGGTYGLTPQQFRAELDKAGLRAVSLGASFDSLRDNLDTVIQNAKTFGVQYVMCGWISHQRPFSEAAARQAIRVFNRAGEKLKAAGITFAYHIHGYEFHPHGNGTLFDLMAAELKPEFVSFELDVFWAFHGGQDPVALMRKYPRRFPLMHLKDMRKGEKGNLTGNAPDDWSVALGAGQIDFPAVLREAKKIGVKWYFVEEESHTPLENIPAGLRYLERVRF